MFQISMANDPIVVDGLNCIVRESSLKDSIITSLPGEVIACELNHARARTARAVLSALSMRSIVASQFSQTLGSHLESVGGC